ncbi:hypothetical protein HPP92_004211 [Vanilla planifolia]|uniref:Uncharacterized protein n=1 Tax=Vanilla planifolia TaxID=51239 RepID=A0A835RVW5_VANPL|nr:hypothetical protein HPP92_004211 [Vanilla planifolia]
MVGEEKPAGSTGNCWNFSSEVRNVTGSESMTPQFTKRARWAGAGAGPSYPGPAWAQHYP